MNLVIEPISAESQVSLDRLKESLPLESIETLRVVSVDTDCLRHKELLGIITCFRGLKEATIETQGDSTGYFWRVAASYPHIKVLIRCSKVEDLYKIKAFVEAGGYASCLFAGENIEEARNIARRIGYKAILTSGPPNPFSKCLFPRGVFIDSFMQVFPCYEQGVRVNEIPGYRDCIIKHGIRHITLRKSRNLQQIMESPVMRDFLRLRERPKFSDVCKEICGFCTTFRKEIFNERLWGRPTPTIKEDAGGDSVLKEGRPER